MLWGGKVGEGWCQNYIDIFIVYIIEQLVELGVISLMQHDAYLEIIMFMISNE